MNMLVSFVEDLNGDNASQKVFNFSFATTALELMAGLRGVESLGTDEGMLFDFGCDFKPIMTPKGVNFPLDLAFISSNFEILELQSIDPAKGFTASPASSDVRYVIEASLGFFEANNIKTGTFVIVSEDV